MDIDRLLALAVEDNVAWCSAVCAAHGSREIVSPASWANLLVSPRYYPNIITRRRGAQLEVERIVRALRAAGLSEGWGIKDSFADLALIDQGFASIVAGHWYGGVIAADSPGGDEQGDWKTVTSAAGLQAWKIAWGGDEGRIFPDGLLSDPRMTFWFRGDVSAIEDGFISFETGLSLGLSNWFSRKNRSLAAMGALQAAASVAGRRPILCWSSDDCAIERTALTRLGPLRVWLSRKCE